MDMNEKPKLSGVPETMLQTVYARAKETKTRGAIKDTKAVEIIDKINYDFSLADKDSAMHSGVVARTIVLDKLANKYLAKSKGAVVVNIACGLDIRCYRMNGYTHWYNLDLPETIAVREKLLHESGEISQIAMSAMDDWSGEITEHDAPAIVIIEGLTMYLSEKDVKEIFDVINKRFEHVTVLVETMSPTMVKRMKEKSIEGSHAKFTWGVKNGAALAALLHDSAKEISKDEMRAIMRAHPELAEGGEERPTPVWHGICAAILARTEWGVEDEAVLSAIACHTAGKPGMSRLDKIVYLADMTSAERDWPGVNKLRKLELKDLDLAMLAALRQTNDFVLSQDKPLDPMSKATYDEIKAEVDARAAKAG